MKQKITFLLLCLSLMVQAQTKFFVHAHQDDAVYFAGVPMFNSTSNSNEKSVFVVTSASDQGVRNGVDTGAAKTNSTVPFYKARDYGLMKAVEYGYTNANRPLNFNQEARDTTVAGKKIRTWNYGANKKLYFFDLPNGQCCSLNMGGYPLNSNESIEFLRKGKISVIRNIHGTETFTWNELVAVLKAIYIGEAGSSSAAANVFSTDVNMTKNPNDHADHYITSVLALDAAKDLANFKSNLHIDYQLSNLTDSTLGTEDLIHKISQFGAMISGIATKEYLANRHIAPSYYNWFTKESIRETLATPELDNLDDNLSAPYAATDIANPVLTENASDLYTIKNANSNLALSINSSGAVVQETVDATNLRQKWYVVKQSAGSYAVINAATHQLLTVPAGATNGVQLTLSAKDAALLVKVQQFLIKSTNTNVYAIRAAVDSNLYLEISASNTTTNFPVSLFSSNGGYNNQRWIMNVYTEQPTQTTNATITNVKSTLAFSYNASNVLIQETVDNTSTKQNWAIEEYADGSIKIKNASNNLYIETNGTATTQNSITLKPSATVVGQKFKKVLDTASGKYIISTWANTNYVLEVFGGYINSGANISVWTKHGATNQQFNFNTITASSARTQAKTNQAALYGNPAKENKVVKVTDLNGFSKPHVTIYEMSGKQVMQQEKLVQNQGLEIDLEGVMPGIYLLTIEENNQKITKKVIVD